MRTWSMTGSYFNVIDISTPASPMIVRRIRSPHRVFDVVVEGDTAYLADGLSGLQVVDISVPAQARFIGSRDNLNFASGVATDGVHVYLADGSAGFQILPGHCRSTTAIPPLSPSIAQELTVRATPNPAMSWVRIRVSALSSWHQGVACRLRRSRKVCAHSRR